MNKLKYLFVILLAAVLIGGCLLQYFYITELSDDLLSYADEMTNSLRSKDLDTARSTLVQFTALWNTHKNRLYSLCDHEIIFNIETELAAFSEDLQNQNTQQLHSEIARLTQALHALAQPEEITLSNIL